MLQAKNPMGRTAKKEHLVKISNYKQVLRDSSLEHMPALGGGNMRRLLSFDGMVGLVCDLLKAEGVDEHQLLAGADNAGATDAAGVVSKQLHWLKQQAVVPKDDWDHDAAYAAYLAHQRSSNVAADDD